MITLTAKVEQRELDKYLKRLDKNRGKPLLSRAEWTLKAASQRELVPRIKKEAPRRSEKGHMFQTAKGGKYVKRGNLRRKVKAKFLDKRWSEVMRPTWVGSTAFYTPFVALGTKPHDWHPGTDADPFIARGSEGAMPRVIEHVRRDVFDTGDGPSLRVRTG